MRHLQSTLSNGTGDCGCASNDGVSHESLSALWHHARVRDGQDA